MMMLVQAQLSTDRGDEDESLIAAAAQGDRGAFGELYSRYARMVHGILLARVPRGGRGRPGAGRLHVRHAAAARVAHGGRVPGLAGRDRAQSRHRLFPRIEAARRLRRADRARARRRGGPGGFEILELIKTLPEAYRETLILRLVEGMTGPEIAARTGLTPESVRVNLCRGMKMLRELL